MKELVSVKPDAVFLDILLPEASASAVPPRPLLKNGTLRSCGWDYFGLAFILPRMSLFR